jgi:hypothetical protein
MRRLLAAAIASVVLAGCGGGTGDLMGMQITGGPGKTFEQMHVTADGRTSCNKGGLHSLPSQLVLDSRTVEREATQLIKEGASYPPALPGRRSFQLKTPDGTLNWGEGQTQPAVLPQAELLALKLEQYCPKPG